MKMKFGRLAFVDENEVIIKEGADEAYMHALPAVTKIIMAVRADEDSLKSMRMNMEKKFSFKTNWVTVESGRLRVSINFGNGLVLIGSSSVVEMTDDIALLGVAPREIEFFHYRKAQLKRPILAIEPEYDEYRRIQKDIFHRNGQTPDNHTLFMFDGVGVMFDDNVIYIGADVEKTPW